ncbi:hypothetical protein F5Y14DRAFT_319731 [Nemania sp. NC0429]|nr:hypothetical protein F5Y14DRAFT_319731 [Nemania sp. NC0429]
MTTLNHSSRRNSAATETTYTGNAADNTDSLAEKMSSYSSREASFDDDEKTLSNLIIRGNSSKHSKTGLSGAMTKLRSKLKSKEENPVQKSPIPSQYYPNARLTLEAIAASRI